jgi:hypothetical protein
MTNSIPTKKVLDRSAEVLVNCDEQTAYDFIGSGPELPTWLKTCGKIHGCISVEVLDGPYDHPGARRLVTFDDGSTLVEELMTFNSPANYSYRVSDFSGAIRKLTSTAYGQCWFDTMDGKTRIKWDYYFTYKNIFARMILSLILTFSYKKFMVQSLDNAKKVIESKNA